MARIPGSDTPIFDKLAQEYVAKEAYERFFDVPNAPLDEND